MFVEKNSTLDELGLYTSKPQMVREKKYPHKKNKDAGASRLLALAKEHPITSAILLTGVVLALVAVIFCVSGFIEQNISGEGFYDFQYPYRNSFNESWKVFFTERIRSRLMHGVFISAIYQVFGFDPPMFYLMAFLLIIGAAIFLVLSLRSFLKSPWMAALLVAAVTWLPLNMPDILLLKKIHHAFAWFAFWLAIFLWQKWAVGRRIGWLFGATLAFMSSVLAYEVTIALLPIAVLLSLSKVRDKKQILHDLGLSIWITLLSGLAFINLESLKPYSGVEAVYAEGGWDIGNLLTNALRLLPQLPISIWGAALTDSGGWIRVLGQLIIAIISILMIFLVWNSFQRKKRSLMDSNLPLVASGLWLAIAGYLPFILAGQGPDGDGIRGASFGFLLLALAGALWLSEQGRGIIGNIFLSGICAYWIMAGFASYLQGVEASRQQDAVLRNVVITLKQQVPDVAEGSVFIFVNSGLGRTGCIGFANMLYDKSKIHCIHLLSGDVEESYTRTQGGLLEKDGRLWSERFIILTFDDSGNVTLIEQLDMDDFDGLPLTWDIETPLVTNHSLISDKAYELGRNFDFYNYMLDQSSSP